MPFNGERSEIFKLFKNVKINTENISLIKIELIDVLKDRIICKLQVSIMGIFKSPWSAIFGKFTVENFDFSFVLNILSKFFRISNRILINPEYF